MPVDIHPSKISMNDYVINFDKSSQRINEIKHQELGLIKFVTSQIDEACGYVSGSNIKVFTSFYKAEMLNIVHIHLNDTSEEVTIDVAYMQDGEEIKDYEIFKADITGQILRYKVLVRNMSIFTILYNSGSGGVEEVPFEEVCVNVGDFVSISSSQLSELPLLAKVVQVPISMIASKDKEKLSGILQGKINYTMGGFCTDRCFERLPGYIDLHVVSLDNCTTVLNQEYPYATPICLCKVPEQLQLSIYESLLEEQERNKKNLIFATLQKLEDLLQEFEENKAVIVKDLGMMQTVLSNLSTQESKIEE